MLYISGIDYESFADGEGCRCTIFVSGCEHHCCNCHNPETWSFTNGKPLTKEMIDEINAEIAKRPFLNGITFSGGDPVYSLPDVLRLIDRLNIPNSNMWMYTGFTWDELIKLVPLHWLLRFDVIVDGPYIEEQRDITLTFRGSRNQRLIDVKKSMSAGEIILYDCQS